MANNDEIRPYRKPSLSTKHLHQANSNPNVVPSFDAEHPPPEARHLLGRIPFQTEPNPSASSATPLTTRLRSSTKSKAARNAFSFGRSRKNSGTSSATSDIYMASSYQSRPDQKASTAPLIHFASNNWNDAHDLDASDEDEAFYTADDDYLIHPKWQAMAIRTKNRIPRRIQRYFFIYIVLLIVSYVAWRVYLGPQWEHNREEVRKMDAELKEVYGQNVRHEFTDTIQLKTLDRELVPGAHEGNENRRLIFIGDVHGCREELEDLLKRVDFQESDDHLIFTGDMIAKGPDSPGVISLAQKYSASCVRGNHEDRVILSITEMDAHHVPLPGPEEDPSKMNDFMDEESFSHGDFKVRKLAKQLSKEQIQYLKECPLILKVGNVEGTGEMATVHGGLIPGIPLEEQDPFQCMNMRSIDLDTHIPKEDHSATPWEKFWNHRQKKLDPAERLTVVYGHDSKRGKNIKKYSKGLDTGCVNGGKLTALVVESGKESVISVSCKNYK